MPSISLLIPARSKLPPLYGGEFLVEPGDGSLATTV